jgi:hypothetical protein
LRFWREASQQTRAFREISSVIRRLKDAPDSGAENGLNKSIDGERKHPSGSKARAFIGPFSARLKVVPFHKTIYAISSRYFASVMGRFLLPDWNAKVEPVPYSKLDDPQTLQMIRIP